MRRTLLLCASWWCERSYARTAARLARAGIESRVAGTGGTSHPFDGAVVSATEAVWPWFVDGDPRFR